MFLLLAALILTWPNIPVNCDGTPADDVARYEAQVAYRYVTSTFVDTDGSTWYTYNPFIWYSINFTPDECGFNCSADFNIPNPPELNAVYIYQVNAYDWAENGGQQCVGE